MSMSKSGAPMGAAILALTAVVGALVARAQEPSQPPNSVLVLFQNVRIFDGKSDTLSAPASVLIRGNKKEFLLAPFPLTLALKLELSREADEHLCPD